MPEEKHLKHAPVVKVTEADLRAVFIVKAEACQLLWAAADKAAESGDLIRALLLFDAGKTSEGVK